ncbi:hypothetical protein Glove_21g172 [Diversispora epigaea]|uniref:RING-type domain-containing protein n=1 Tax=Diversispora epigaea TaxID=1348612 RepID=A0A397JL15_9GLOM|nr:hypothetical protein Glove_21g172 [Diversispora epigaea]
MYSKNTGPCSINNCTIPTNRFRIITELAYEKCQKKNMLELYPYLHIGQQLCHSHYCKIIEVDRGQRKSNKKLKKKIVEPTELIDNSNNNTDTVFSSNVKIMTKVLYEQQRRKCADLELDPIKFKNMIEDANPQLKGATWESIDTISTLGYSACAKTVEEYRKKIQKEHVTKIEKHFMENKNILHIYNIDDYHSIHEVRRPDTVSTSLAKHFATCVAKPVNEFPSVPLVFNGIFIHNPLNVEAPRICWYLINKYTGIFDISYFQKNSIINQFDRIEMLTIHNYNDNITERKEERSMKGLQLIGFKEQNLHSISDYINALNIIISVNNKTQHLRGFVAPIVADWPGQIFIRKILYKQTLFQSNFSQDIKSFLPMLGPLHVSLNSREQVILVHHSFFERLFHFVFGKNKKLAKKPRPWRINLLLELSKSNTSPNATVDNIIKQAYVIMNQDPIFKDTYCKTRHYPYNIPMLDFLSNKTSLFLLQYFHDLYCNLGKSAPKLKNKRNKKQHPNIYTLATLEEEVDLRRLPTGYSTSYPPQQGLCDRCKLPFANEDGVTFICGHSYHTGCYDKKCIYCEEFYKRGIFENVNSFLKRIEKGADTLTQEDLGDDDGNDIEEGEEQSEEIEIQDISNNLEIEINQIENCYHTGCYDKKCIYCEEFYKRGIFENVNSFLKRIEKGADTLTQEDLGDDDGNDIEEGEEQSEEIEIQDISNNLEIEINQIENW